MCACSGLWDRLSHRSFAGLTTQTQFHHNRFDKRPESVYRETQESRSDTAGNGEDTINAAFPSNRFFFFFFLSRQQSQQQQSAPTVHFPLWGKLRYCVWALGSLCGNLLRLLAHTVQSFLLKGSTRKTWVMILDRHPKWHDQIQDSFYTDTN